MISTRTLLFAVAAGAASIASAADPSGALRYTTNCVVIDSNSADGYVTNQSTDTYHVIGEVRFVFSAPDSMSRPAIVEAENSAVPAGQTARVARVKLAFQPLPGETCRFEVKDAIRKG
jgi:hypothetical protein